MIIYVDNFQMLSWASHRAPLASVDGEGTPVEKPTFHRREL